MADIEIDVLGEETYEVEMEEVLPIVVSEGGTVNHALLTNRDASDQHPITAIGGLRAELDNIWALKENFSNKYGHANYYLWADGGGEISERVGYFVSACDGDCSKIAICNGGAVLGVSVDTAAFIGNKTEAVQTKCNVCGNVADGHRITCSNSECQSQNVDYVRNIEYGLVATSGIIKVRCENDVERGNYVMPNVNGVAKKVDDTYGYRVIEIDNILGVPYAAIDLDSSMTSVHNLGVKVDRVESKVRTNEQNIVSAVNVSNQAYNRAQESATVSTEAIRQALEAMGRVETAEGIVNGMNETLASVNVRSEQAKAIAASAVSSANAIRTEAVQEASKAIQAATDVKNEFASMEQQITDVDGKVTVATKYISSEYVVVSDDPGADSREQTKIYYNATETMYYEYQNGAWQTKNTLGELESINTEIIYYVVSTEKYWYYQNNLWKDSKNAYDAGLPMAVSGLQVKSDENGAAINNLVSWQDTAKSSIARIEQKADANGAYIQSTVFNINKYSVGLYSQAYNFTLEQAATSFEGEILYVPTESHDEEYVYATEGTKCDTWDETGKDNRLVYYVVATAEDGTETKTYYYWGQADEADGNPVYGWVSATSIPTYERNFIPGYLYKWGRLNGTGPYRWITVDKYYSPLNPVDALNSATQSVYFQTHNAPVINDGDAYGYWYTNGDTLTGTAEGYDAYTLYKWDSYKQTDAEGNVVTDDYGNPVFGYHWVTAATLAGNTLSRATSMIRQDANRIAASVVNTKGDVASLQVKVDEQSTQITGLTSWKEGTDNSISVLQQKSDATGSSIAQVAANVGGYEDWDGSAERDTSKIYYYDEKYYYYKDDVWTETTDPFEAGVVINAASIVTAVTEDESSIALLSDKITLQASQIVLDGTTFFVGENGETTTIDGNHITTGSITADQIATDAICSNNYAHKDENGNPITPSVENEGDTPFSDAGTFLNLEDGTLYSPKFVIDNNGNAFFDGTLGANTVSAIEITADNITSGTIDASKIAVTNLDASEITTGELNADVIKVSDLNAFGATIGGWEIGDNSIRNGGTGLLSNNIVCLYGGANSQEIGEKKTSTKTVTDVQFNTDVSYGEFEIENCAYIYSIKATVDYGDYGGAAANITTKYPNYGNTVKYSYQGSGVSGSITFEYEYTETMDASFLVLEDGTLYTNSISMQGGFLGGWIFGETDVPIGWKEVAGSQQVAYKKEVAMRSDVLREDVSDGTGEAYYEYQTWLTPSGVSVKSQYKSETSSSPLVITYKTWRQIMLGA